jgi:hypothetical protein
MCNIWVILETNSISINFILRNLILPKKSGNYSSIQSRFSFILRFSPCFSYAKTEKTQCFQSCSTFAISPLYQTKRGFASGNDTLHPDNEISANQVALFIPIRKV